TDAYIYQNAGCNTVHELAFTLAQLNEQLHFIQENNLSVVNKKFILITSSSINFFQNLCKIKALRNLSKFLLKEYGLDNEIFIHANTSLLNKTSKDSYNNLIRSTIEAMGAVAGGADSVAITPYNTTSVYNDTNAQRLAINQMHIFKEEAFLSKVSDVGAGSFYIETYSEELEQKAWEKFKKIEDHGGLIQYCKEGKLTNIVNADAEKLKSEFISGKKILTGVNKFQNPKEKDSPRIFPPKGNPNGLSMQSIEEWLTEIKVQHA
ncbi:MAG: methylmalonyl-CoA mutase family protein, partial [Bacteroidota bacterium]